MLKTADEYPVTLDAICKKEYQINKAMILKQAKISENQLVP